MNTRFKFIIAVMAAGAVSASCTKDVTPPNSENDEIAQATEASRVISVSFSPQTKTTLEGLQPKFAEGDSILISNGEVLDTCEVSVNGDNATFTTELDGLLKAVYPASAAELDADGKTIKGVLVSTEQDGTFANAHICMAVMKAENDKSLLFENKTALFEITPPEGVKSFTIKSLNTIDSTTGQRSTTPNALVINTEGATDETQRGVTVSNDTLTTFYVSLVPGVKLSDLSFDAGGTYGMKGIPMKDIETLATSLGKSLDAANGTAANTKYTINNQNWHPYVTIGGFKWATMNVGASSAADFGQYFQWGETAGHVCNGTTTGSAFEDGYKFSWGSCPFAVTDNPTFSKYVPSSQTSYLAESFSGDTKTVLDLADDAANANWGGSWRMPTKAEFDNLVTNKEWDSTNKGYKFGSPNQIFLPAAGYGDGTDLNDVGELGYYWSSSLFTSLPLDAYCLYFYDGLADTCGSYRFLGQSVRALSE